MNKRSFMIAVGVLERSTRPEVLLAWYMPCGTRSKRSVVMSNVQKEDNKIKLRGDVYMADKQNHRVVRPASATEGVVVADGYTGI